MIRSKQMDERRRLNTNMRELGAAKKPSLEKHVMIALTSGELPKLKPVAKISQVARAKIIDGTYNSSRTLSFGDVFSSCNGFEAETKQYEAHEKSRKIAVARYERVAEKVMLRALDKDADAEVISEELHEAAERAGLKTLVAPVFGNTQDEE